MVEGGGGERSGGDGLVLQRRRQYAATERAHSSRQTGHPRHVDVASRFGRFGDLASEQSGGRPLRRSSLFDRRLSGDREGSPSNRPWQARGGLEKATGRQVENRSRHL